VIPKILTLHLKYPHQNSSLPNQRLTLRHWEEKKRISENSKYYHYLESDSLTNNQNLFLPDIAKQIVLTRKEKPNLECPRPYSTPSLFVKKLTKI
jgi:hypothetical protein